MERTERPRIGVLLLILLLAASAKGSHPYGAPTGCGDGGSGLAGNASPLKASFPVYIHPGPFRVLGSLAEPEKAVVDYRGITERAMAIWENVTGQRVGFRVVESPRDAWVRVVFFERAWLHGGYATGRGNVALYLFPTPDGQSYDEAAMTMVAVHEFGHVLGLAHSNDPGSIMYPEGIKSEPCPAPGDVAAVQQRYDLRSAVEFEGPGASAAPAAAAPVTEAATALATLGAALAIHRGRRER